jgi:hypothetical protein
MRSCCESESRMQRPFSLDAASPPDAANVAARLRHSWLTNQILTKSPDDVAFLSRQGPWRALEHDFPAAVRQTRELAANLEAGFSPSQLVATVAPFPGLDAETSGALRIALHRAFVEEWKPTLIENEILDATDGLERALAQLRGVWVGGSESDVRSAWDNLSGEARKLLMVLETLPQGVVLP